MKKLAVIAAALTASITLAGCGSGSQPASPDSPTTTGNQFSDKAAFEQKMKDVIEAKGITVTSVDCIKTSSLTATCLVTGDYNDVHRITIQCQSVDADGVGHDCIYGEE